MHSADAGGEVSDFTAASKEPGHGATSSAGAEYSSGYGLCGVACMALQVHPRTENAVTSGEPSTNTQPGIAACCREAEDRAYAILSKRGDDGRITHADLWAVTSLWRCSPNRNRKRLSTEGDDSVPSDTFGVVTHGVLKTWHITKRTLEYPSVCILLNRYLFGQLTPEQRDEFRFSTITVNKDFASARHRDRNNVGASAIVGAGPFSGGGLLYWDKDDGSIPLSQLSLDEAKRLRLQKKLQLFDGRKAHQTAPFSGSRVSVVWYVYSDVSSAPSPMLDSVRMLGFRVPGSTPEARDARLSAVAVPLVGVNMASSFPPLPAEPLALRQRVRVLKTPLLIMINQFAS